MHDVLRRLFLLAFAPRAKPRAPEDPDTMNAFAAEYNKYVTMLHSGIVDVHQWAKVEAAWSRLKA